MENQLESLPKSEVVMNRGKLHTEIHEQKIPYLFKKKPRFDDKGRLTLPVEEVEIYPEGDLSKMVCIGQETTDKLEIFPASLFIKRYIRYKYAPKIENSQPIQTGELPGRVIVKEIPGPGLLTPVRTGKNTDHRPLYQQRRRFRRQGVSIARSTKEGWVRQGLEKLRVLYDHLLKNTRRLGYLQADEMPAPATLSESEERSLDVQKQPRKILDFIHGEHTNPDLSVAMIADRLNTSKSAMYRKWNKYHSESIADYITNLRLEEAKQLLLIGEYHISEVANMSGFNSQSYFAKVFKKKVGVSPTTFQSDNGR